MPRSNRIALLIIASIIVAISVVLAIRLGKTHETSKNENLNNEAQQLIAQQQTNDSLRRVSYYRKNKNYHARKQKSYPSVENDVVAHSSTTNQPDKPLYPSKKKLTFDLNKADTLDLEQLYGIGPTLARRIVRYRERLGGFYSIEQLKEVYGLDVQLVERLSSQLTLSDTPLRTLNPNTATLNELKQHPYLDYYQAKAIVTFRQQGGKFHSSSDLLKIGLLDEATIRKIEPYLSFIET
ncbi:MAG: helix-hairpin-helix domain-containing protein [Bacteroidales bacterium]|nr:helix-hairpin-helix domain-containing protein [Bacteroidales bacterium]